MKPEHKDYAALMLMEILFERGLVNQETLKAAKERIRCTTGSYEAAQSKTIEIEETQ